MQHLTLPPIAHEDEAAPSPSMTLGYAGPVNSRLSIGRSDVVITDPGEILDDELLAKQLAEQAGTIALARVTLRVNFRPADGEQFTAALFAVDLRAEGEDPSSRPFARELAPDRLSAGSFTAQSGVTLGLQAGAAGAGLKAEKSSSGSAEVEEPYVVAAGLGEHDPEWRYRPTKTMLQLSGSYEMGLIVQVSRAARAEALLSASATVQIGRHRTEVEWTPEPELARIDLNPPC
jgi:hypothetical protein